MSDKLDIYLQNQREAALWYCVFTRYRCSIKSNGSSKEPEPIANTSQPRHRRRSRLLSRCLVALLHSVWTAVGIFALLVTLAGAIVFFPRLSISSDATLDPSDPFATPFILKNDGYFSVYSAEIICNTVAKVGSMNLSILGLGFTSPDLINRYIGPDEPIEFMCPLRSMFPAPVTNAEIEIYIGFKATMFPKSCTKKCFHAKTWKDEDDKLRWFIDSAVGKCERPAVIIQRLSR
jgi:hypothetical protein